MDTLTDNNLDMKVVDTSKNTNLKMLGSSIDLHIWLSPQQVQPQMGMIRQALATLDPEHASYYEKNAAAYKEDLEQLDTLLQQQFTNTSTEVFMVFHPSWGYLARDYGLKQIPIQQDGNKPTSKRMQSLVTRAKQKNITTIFVQQQFDKNIARSIAEEVDADIVSIDPLSKQYIDNLKNMSDTITG